jgi:hypothetical protein
VTAVSSIENICVYVYVCVYVREKGEGNRNVLYCGNYFIAAYGFDLMSVHSVSVIFENRFCYRNSRFFF